MEKKFRIPIPPELARVELGFTEVPPPAKAPVEEIAETLGLIAGLRTFKSICGGRCTNCNRIQTGWFAWVPDGVRMGDPPDYVTEQCRLNAHNGHASGWCLACAQQIGKTEPKAATSWWKRFFFGRA